MKLLTALSALQALGILVLIFLVVDHEPRATRDAAATSQPAPQPSSFALLDEARLRSIIAAEFAARLTPAMRTHPAPVIAAESARDEIADRERTARVVQRIDGFTGGTLSSEQMYDLEAEIAQLDVAGRTEMLSKLMRAMNSGAIRGQF